MGVDKKISAHTSGAPALLTDNTIIERGSDNFKLTVGDVRDFVSYQNSAMAIAVDVFVRRKSDGTIVEVYEPVRNNLVRFNSVIDKFRFDLSSWVNNTINEVDFSNIDDSTTFANNQVDNIDIDGGGFTGFIYVNNTHKGTNNNEITLAGQDVLIKNNSFGVGRASGNAGYLHDIGQGSDIKDCNFLGTFNCDFNGNFGSIESTQFGLRSGFEIIGTGASAVIQVSTFNPDSYVTINNSGAIIYSTFNTSSYVIITEANVNGCYFGNTSNPVIHPNITLTNCRIGIGSNPEFISNCSNSEFNNITAGNFVQACTNSIIDNITCTNSTTSVAISDSYLKNVELQNLAASAVISKCDIQNATIDIGSFTSASINNTTISQGVILHIIANNAFLNENVIDAESEIGTANLVGSKVSSCFVTNLKAGFSSLTQLYSTSSAVFAVSNSKIINLTVLNVVTSVGENTIDNCIISAGSIIDFASNTGCDISKIECFNSKLQFNGSNQHIANSNFYHHSASFLIGSRTGELWFGTNQVIIP